jgi:flagellar biosynthesis component FlhA
VERFLADPACAPHAIVVTGALRPLLAEFFERVGPRVDVYSYGEIPPQVDLDPAAVLDATYVR